MGGIDQLTGRLTRANESIASTLGKEASFRVVGGETEIDKVLADQLQDPLLHLLRNALDHGIETPGERVAAGKPREGRVTLSAAARGRTVVLKLAAATVTCHVGPWRSGGSARGT